MTDYQVLALKSVEALLDRGMDFLVEEAKEFVRDKRFYKLSKNQVYALHGEINKGTDFAVVKARVKEWLDHQSKKKAGKKWGDIQGELMGKMFDWNQDRIENISKLAELHLKKDSKRLLRCIRNLLTMNLTDELRLKLARSFFSAVLVSYRCYSDEDIKGILEGMDP